MVQRSNALRSGDRLRDGWTEEHPAVYDDQQVRQIFMLPTEGPAMIANRRLQVDLFFGQFR